MESIKNQSGIYILGGLTFVLGLAWNDAITTAINKYYPLDKNGIVAKFVYAMLLTIFVVFLANHIFTKSSK